MTDTLLAIPQAAQTAMQAAARHAPTSVVGPEVAATAQFAQITLDQCPFFVDGVRLLLLRRPRKQPHSRLRRRR